MIKHHSKREQTLDVVICVHFLQVKVVDSCQGFCKVTSIKDDQFNLLVWLLLSLLSLFSYSKAINFHALAINI